MNYISRIRYTNEKRVNLPWFAEKNTRTLFASMLQDVVSQISFAGVQATTGGSVQNFQSLMLKVAGICWNFHTKNPPNSPNKMESAPHRFILSKQKSCQDPQFMAFLFSNAFFSVIFGSQICFKVQSLSLCIRRFCWFTASFQPISHPGRPKNHLLPVLIDVVLRPLCQCKPNEDGGTNFRWYLRISCWVFWACWVWRDLEPSLRYDIRWYDLIWSDMIWYTLASRNMFIYPPNKHGFFFWCLEVSEGQKVWVLAWSSQVDEIGSEIMWGYKPIDTLLGTNISPPKARRWNMLVPWGVKLSKKRDVCFFWQEGFEGGWIGIY